MTKTFPLPFPETATLKRPVLSRGRGTSRRSHAPAQTRTLQELPVNYPARVFRDLTGAFQQDAAGDRVDVLAAELASCVADARGSLCVGLVHKEVVPKLFGLVFLLDGYGLLLRQRYREQGDGVFVFLERKTAAESEFAGSVVVERFADVALPRAA